MLDAQRPAQEVDVLDGEPEGLALAQAVAEIVLERLAAPFDSPAEIGSGELVFVEEYAPGRFQTALGKRDTAAAYGHDLMTQPPLGALWSGTLEAWEAPDGLRFNSTWAPRRGPRTWHGRSPEVT